MFSFFRHTILTILNYAKEHAKKRGDKELAIKVKQCLDNFKKLEEKGMLNRADNYTQFLRDVALVSYYRFYKNKKKNTQI
jgi:protein-arginine kinase activator protein McsA